LYNSINYKSLTPHPHRVRFGTAISTPCNSLAIISVSVCH